MSAPIKHSTAMVLIKTAGTPTRVLLLEHRKHKRWLPPGGHQEAHENIFECAIREVKEETGVDITQFMPQVQVVDQQSRLVPMPHRIAEIDIPQRGDEAPHHHLDHTYITTVPAPFDIVKSDVETDKFGWFTLEETKNIYIPDDVRMVLEQEIK